MKNIFRIEGIGTEVIEGECNSVKEALSTLGLNLKQWNVEKIKETATKVEYSVTRKGREPEVTGADSPAPSVPCDLPEAAQPAEPEEGVEASSLDDPLDVAEAPELEETSELSPDAPEEEIGEPDEEPAPVLSHGVITINRQLITDALTVAQDLVSKKSFLPILSFALIDATEEASCTIISTNLEQSFRISLPCASSGEVKCCIPVTLTLEEIKALPKDITEVTFTFAGELFRVNGRCEINLTEEAEYPEVNFPEGDSFDVPGLLQALRKVLPAMSEDESRYILCGAHIDAPEGKVVATDGYRLHMDDIEGNEDAPAVVIPKLAAKLIAKHAITDKFTAIMKEDQVSSVSFSMKGGCLLTRVMTGSFPDYRNIIPSTTGKLSFSSKDLLEVLSGTNPLSRERVRLSVNGSLAIEAEGEGGCYRWQIPCETDLPESTTLAFNPKFLVDALKSFQGDSATILVPPSGGACLINNKAIVMPIRG